MAAIGVACLTLDSHKPRAAKLSFADLPLEHLGRSQTHQLQFALRGERAELGISARSLQSARRVAVTEVGSVFLISGERGWCLVLGDFRSCTQQSVSREWSLVVLAPALDGRSVVGAGLTSPEAHKIHAASARGRYATFAATQGIFAVGTRAGFSVDDVIVFSTRRARASRLAAELEVSEENPRRALPVTSCEHFAQRWAPGYCPD